MYATVVFTAWRQSVLRDNFKLVEMDLTIFIGSLVLFASCVTGQGYDRRVRCGPVCLIWCEYGNVMKDGCPTCQCNPAPTIRCPRNSTPVFPEQVCYPWRGLGSPCGRNAFCSTASRSLSTGICCRRPIAPPDTHCPPNDVITTCQITKDNCFSNRDCPLGQKCCSRGCGKVCVNAFGAGYFPGFTQLPTFRK